MHRVALLRLAPSSSALHQRARRLSERTAQRPASVAFATFASRATTSLPATSPFASTAPAMTAATAAQKPAFTAVVKGMPETGELRDCPFSHRVLLTLEAKGIPYKMEFVDTNVQPKPQWLVEANGGKVPVLKERDELLEQDKLTPDSDSIVQMLEERFPTPSMKSSAPQGLDSKVLPLFVQYLKSGKEDEGDKKQALMAELQHINDFLAQPGKGPLFGGKNLDATDASFAPKLYNLVVALPHFKPGFELPPDMTALWRYLAYVQLLPAWQKVDYGSGVIIEDWERHP